MVIRRLSIVCILSLVALLSITGEKGQSLAAGPLSDVTTVSVGSAAHDIDIVDDFAYVATATGVTILDISNPAAPVVRGSTATNPIGRNMGIAVNLPYAFVANQRGGLQIFNVSNPDAPTFVAAKLVVGKAWDVAVKGDIVYIISFSGRISVIDVSDPFSPQIGKQIGLVAWVGPAGDTQNLLKLNNHVVSGNAKATGIDVSGDVLVAVDWAYGRVYYYDVSVAADPIFSGTHYAPFLLRTEVDPERDAIYMLSAFGGTSGIYTVPLSSLSPDSSSKHVLCPECDYLPSNAGIDMGGIGIVPGGQYIFYAGGKTGEFHVVDVTNPMEMEDVGEDDIGRHNVRTAEIMGLAAKDDYIYLCGGDTGVQVHLFPGLSEGAPPSSGGDPLELSVASGADDGREYQSGVMRLADTSLLVGRLNTFGFRFTGVTIPQGATITAAELRLSSLSANTKPITIRYRGEAVGNSTPFSGVLGEFSNRAKTSAFVEDEPAAWTLGAYNASPDLTAIVQEIVDRGDWAGSALALFIEDNGSASSRQVGSFESTQSPTKAATLHIEFSSEGAPPPPPPSPELGVSPSGLTFHASAGGGSPADQAVSISNTGSGTLNWTASPSGAAWLSIDGTSGPAPATLPVSVDSSGLAAGTYNGSISINGGSAGSDTVSVTLEVALPAPATLSVTPGSLTFNATVGGGSPADQAVNITNTGSGTLNWTASTSGAGWLSIDGTEATSGPAPATLQVSVDPSGLVAGTYTGSISIDGGAAGSDTVNVTLNMSGVPPSGGDPLELSVASGADDGREYQSGVMRLADTSLLVGRLNTFGFRFTGVTIPQGATITAAELRLSSLSANTKPITIRYRGEAVGNSTPFSGVLGEFSNRAKTSAFVEDEPAPWILGAYNASPDLTGIVQEIVDRGDWAGSALTIFIEDNGSASSRSVSTFERNPAQAAQIIITYTVE